jgi:hypothetical protein
MAQLYRQNATVETAPLQEESILFHAGNNRFCLLNRTSSFIWGRLATPTSPEQLAADLAASFDGVSDAQALEDVQKALAELAEMGLVDSVASPAQ